MPNIVFVATAVLLYVCLPRYPRPYQQTPPAFVYLYGFVPVQSALSLEIMCNTVFSDVMQTIGAEDPTLPQQPIPMQAGIAVVDIVDTHLNEEVLPLSARCRHPALEAATENILPSVAH